MEIGAIVSVASDPIPAFADGTLPTDYAPPSAPRLTPGCSALPRPRPAAPISPTSTSSSFMPASPPASGSSSPRSAPSTSAAGASSWPPLA